LKKVLITTNRYKEFDKYIKNKEIIPFPTIKIVPIPFEIDIKNYDFFIFTSVNTVKFFFEKVKPDLLKNKTLIAVGEKTAQRLKELGFKEMMIPKEFKAEGIVKLIEDNWDRFKGKSILIPQAKVGRNIILKHFEDKKINIKTVPVYETIGNTPENKEEVRKMLNSKQIETVVFTSPSTFYNFLKIFDKEIFKNVKIAVIGETTKKAVEKEGLKVDIMPEKFTFEELSKLITAS